MTLSRVKVFTLDSQQYPAADWGLRDFELQVSVDGEWRTVATIRGNTDGVVERAFTEVSATALQVVMQDTNDHNYSRVIELEAYR